MRPVVRSENYSWRSGCLIVYSQNQAILIVVLLSFHCDIPCIICYHFYERGLCVSLEWGLVTCPKLRCESLELKCERLELRCRDMGFRCGAPVFMNNQMLIRYHMHIELSSESRS